MMATWSLVASIIFTIVILLLSLLTISKGYGFKHTVDPPTQQKDDETDGNKE